jgi:hypothetical protein
MINRSRLAQISRIENKPPNHLSLGAIYKEVLYSFIQIIADKLLTPFPIFLRKVFCQNDALLKKPEKNLDFKRYFPLPDLPMLKRWMSI